RDDDDRRLGRRAGDLGTEGARGRGQVPAGDTRGRADACRAPVTERPLAPFGRRLCEVVDNHASGGYRVFSLRDGEGPAPAAGQFYMLAAERRWEERGERPFLPRAFSVADAVAEDDGLRLDFLVEGVGP